MQTRLWWRLWWGLTNSEFGGSLESGGRFRVGAFGRKDNAAHPVFTFRTIDLGNPPARTYRPNVSRKMGVISSSQNFLLLLIVGLNSFNFAIFTKYLTANIVCRLYEVRLNIL
jgi:hypothetical protein